MAPGVSAACRIERAPDSMVTNPLATHTPSGLLPHMTHDAGCEPQRR